MATVVRTTMNGLIGPIKARVRQITGLADHRVLYVATSKVGDLGGERYVLLYPGGFLNQENWSVGSGRKSIYLARELFATIRTRVDRDPINEAEQWYKDTLGFFALEHQVMDALIDFKPMDASANILVLSPIKLMGGARPGKDDESNAPPGWGESTLRFSVHYMPDVDQGYQ